MAKRPLETQLVGSYSKPDWLIARERYPYRTEEEAWRPAPEHLPQAQDDATLLAIYDQENAGLDIITDGEARRARFDNYFLRYDGIDNVNLGHRDHVFDRDLSGSDVRPEVATAWSDPERGKVPRVFAPIKWSKPLTLNDATFLRSNTKRRTKATVLGPLTSACRIGNEYYSDFDAIVRDFAVAVNQEVRALDAAGVDVIQIDEPDVFLRRTRTLGIAVEAINQAIQGVRAHTIVHVCHGYPTSAINKRMSPLYSEALQVLAASNVDGISLEWEEPGYDHEILRSCGDKQVVLGVLNLGTQAIETADHIAGRVREALRGVPADRLSLAPDCGLWHLPRAVAFGKIRAMAHAAHVLRSEIAG